MNWRVKAVIQKVLSAMPLGIGEHLNREIPRLLNRRRAEMEAERAVQISLSHYADIVRSDDGRAVRTVLELGTGYNFFTALPMALLGYEVTTVDLARDVHFSAAISLLRALERELPKLLAAAPPAAREGMTQRYRQIAASTNFSEFLQRSAIRYLAPYDADRFAADFEDAFDYVYSHCVLEHIPPAAFPSVLNMLRRVCRPGARYSHQIDMRDHRSSEGFLIDKNLSYLDYLRFSEASWRFWNGNAIAYTNRWRKEDYVRALRESGFLIDGTNDWLYEGSSLPLPRVSFDPAFRGYDEHELRVMSTFAYGRAPVAALAVGEQPVASVGPPHVSAEQS